METCLFCWLVSKFGELGWRFVTTLILFFGVYVECSLMVEHQQSH